MIFDEAHNVVSVWGPPDIPFLTQNSWTILSRPLCPTVRTKETWARRASSLCPPFLHKTPDSSCHLILLFPLSLLAASVTCLLHLTCSAASARAPGPCLQEWWALTGVLEEEHLGSLASWDRGGHPQPHLSPSSCCHVGSGPSGLVLTRE